MNPKNVVQADHGKLKRLIKPTLGFKSMKTAYATIKHPCFEASPDSVSFDGFWVSGPGFSTGCPHLDGRQARRRRSRHRNEPGR